MTAPPRDNGHPASRLQTRLWLLTQLYPDLPLFLIPITLRLHGDLDRTGVQAALTALVERHESLRTRFTAGDEGPVQVLDEGPVELACTDLSGAADPARAWLTVLTGECARPIGLERAPLLRAHLARVGPSEHLLAVLVHHIGVDGTSIEVLLDELAALYRAWAAGEDLTRALGPAPASYLEFSRWHDEQLRGPDYEESCAFWRTELGGQPEFAPPADRPRPDRPTFEVHEERTPIPEDLAAAVRAYARRRRTTPNVVLSAVFSALLARRNGPLRDVVIAAPWSLRHGRWLAGTVGFFINTVPMRVRVTPDATFRDVLDATRGAFFEAMDHGYVPFDEIVAMVNPVRDQRRLPITSVSFQVLSSGGAKLEFGPATAELEAGVEGASEFDLIWDVVDPEEGGMTVSAKYTADLYDRDTIARMSAQYVRVLAAAVADPDQLVLDLPLDDGTERARLAGLGGAVQDLAGMDPADGPFLLLDDAGRPVPVGAVGAVHVLAESGEPGEPAGLPGRSLRRTGVLAVRRADGTARVHTPPAPRDREVSAADLLEHPDVTAVEMSPAPDGQRTIAFVATDSTTLSPAELREFLRERAPGATPPSWFVVLDGLPLDGSGDVDSGALDDLARTTGLLSADDTASPLEETVRGVWQEFLAGPVPGLDDGFFAIGGHSLAAVRIAARLQRLLGRPVPVQDVLAHSTIRSFAAWLTENGDGAGAGEPDADPVSFTEGLTADLRAASADELAVLHALTGGTAGPGKDRP